MGIHTEMVNLFGECEKVFLVRLNAPRVAKKDQARMSSNRAEAWGMSVREGTPVGM